MLKDYLIKLFALSLFSVFAVKVQAANPALLVTNWFSDDLSIVDLAAAKETRRIPAGKGARAFGRFISP